MSHLRAPAARADRREGGRHGRPLARTAPAPAETHIRPQLLRLAVLPPTAVALSACAVVLFTVRSTGVRPGVTLWAVLAGAVAVTGVGIVIAAVAADRAARSVSDRIAALRRGSARGEAELRAVMGALRRGEAPPPRTSCGGPPGHDADDFDLLAADLARAHDGAVTAVVLAAQLSSQAGSEQKLEVFVNLARRLQSLVHREISILDELENEIEDPDLLKGLFHVDHLATRVRRHAENLAVLGGAVSRRQWSNPVSMTEVLRSAIAEVEQYSRVKLVPPIEGELRGHAVADVIHLLAELVENATVFSAPHTQVLLRANLVTSGLAVEVEDRGLGMPVEEQARMNALLADPDQVNVGRLLADGRIGLFVVSQLARRHGIRVRLQNNIYGGVQAVLIVPQALLGSSSAAHGTDTNGAGLRLAPAGRLPLPPAPQTRPLRPGLQSPTTGGAPRTPAPTQPHGSVQPGATPDPAWPPAQGTPAAGWPQHPARVPDAVAVGRTPGSAQAREAADAGWASVRGVGEVSRSRDSAQSEAQSLGTTGGRSPGPAPVQGAIDVGGLSGSADVPGPDGTGPLPGSAWVRGSTASGVSTGVPGERDVSDPGRASASSWTPTPTRSQEQSTPASGVPLDSARSQGISASGPAATSPQVPPAPDAGRRAGSWAGSGSSPRPPDAPQASGRRPAPLPVRGARETRANPAEAVPGIRQADRPAVEEHAGIAPVPRVGTVRGTIGKPQLPRRRAQEHIVPQLRGGPTPRQDTEQPVGHDPGLMAAFQRGIGLAEAQQSLEADVTDPPPYLLSDASQASEPSARHDGSTPAG